MNEDVNISRSAVLSEIIQHPDSFSPCRGGVQADLKDKSKLNACIESPTKENTHWFANKDALDAALKQMDQNQLNTLQQHCAKQGSSAQDYEVAICEAVSAAANAPRHNNTKADNLER